MEDHIYEQYDQDPQEDYQNYLQEYSQDVSEDYEPNSLAPVENNVPRQQTSGKKPDRDEAKLFKSIVKRYGPGEQKNAKQHKENQDQDQQSKFSFHPRVKSIPKDIYNEAGKKVEVSKEEQWERLLRPKTEVIQEREKLKREKEALEIQSNCSFQPAINKDYQLSSVKYASAKNQTASDRLYAEGIEKIKTKELDRRKSEEDPECTFHPNVKESVAVLKGEKVAKNPLHERLGEIMKQKQEFLQKIRMHSELADKDMVFKPTLGEHTEILANAKKQVQDVTERLMMDAASKANKKLRQTEEYEAQLTSVCTFQPNANSVYRSNDYLLANNDLYAVEKDVVTRQYLLADIQRQHHQKKAAEILSQEGCTFVPKINKISQFLIDADPDRANENIKEKVDRLSKKDAQKRDIFQEQIQKAHYDQYTFKPEINKISKDIGKRASLDELAYNREAKEHLRILREKSIDNMLNGCSFQPEVNRNKKYETVEALYKDEAQIMDNVKILAKQKELKYDQQRKIKEYTEMKDCTFKPKIKGEVAEEVLKPKLASSVAGMDKFIEMRERHKKLQEAKKKREEEVFGIEKRYSAAKHEGFTTPQPFKLSKGPKNSIREAKVAQELKQAMDKNTFKPSTNEGVGKTGK